METPPRRQSAEPLAGEAQMIDAEVVTPQAAPSVAPPVGDPAAATPPPKRRRLTQKSPRPENMPPPASHRSAGPRGDDCDEGEDPEEGDACSPLEKAFRNRFHKWRMAKLAECDSPEDTRRIRKQVDLRRQTWPGRVALVRKFLADVPGIPADVRSWAMKFYTEKAKEVEKKATTTFLNARSVLLTWNGPWGVISERPADAESHSPSHDDKPEDLESHSPREEDDELPIQVGQPEPELSAGLSPTDLCELARKHSRVKVLWKSLVEFAQEWADAIFADVWCACLEVCLQTYSAQGVVRVHAHVFFRSASRMHVRSQDFFKWQGSMPHSNASVMGVAGRKFQSGNAGLYYLQVPKLGSLHSVGNVAPFRDYLVSGEWVFNLLQAEKIDCETARRQLIMSAKNLPRLLGCLDKLVSERNSLKLSSLTRDVAAKLRGMARPFKVIPAVVDWQRAFEDVSPRYPFLVLDGPSRTGKTQFAKSLAPLDEVYEVNMACAPEADLRTYDPLVHTVIVYDECSPEQVIRQKKPFQAGASSVLLGASGTNCHAYHVWVHRKKMVICSNVWAWNLQRLPAVDAEWLNANSTVVRVEERLYEE